MSEKKWYAVYTKPRWEKKVAALLTKKNIENYCPLNKVRKQWTDRKKLVFEPLFTSYVFVKVSIKEHGQLLKTDGVYNIVYWLGKAAVIREDEIEVIKQFLSEHEYVLLERTKVNLNDTVRIINGPLMLREGSIIEIKNKTVKLLLPSLGYNMIAELSKTNLEKISPEVSIKNIVPYQ